MVRPGAGIATLVAALWVVVASGSRRGSERNPAALWLKGLLPGHVACNDGEMCAGLTRVGNVTHLLPRLVAVSAYVPGQLGETGEATNRLLEGEQLLERQKADTSDLPAFIGGWVVPGLLLGLLDDAATPR
jgi:hypothetical protein